jgi:hypothetical protein
MLHGECKRAAVVKIKSNPILVALDLLQAYNALA